MFEGQLEDVESREAAEKMFKTMEFLAFKPMFKFEDGWSIVQLDGYTKCIELGEITIEDWEIEVIHFARDIVMQEWRDLHK